MRIKCEKVKQQLLSDPKDCYVRGVKILLTLLKERTKVERDWVVQASRSIAARPNAVDEYVKQRAAL